MRGLGGDGMDQELDEALLSIGTRYFERLTQAPAVKPGRHTQAESYSPQSPLSPVVGQSDFARVGRLTVERGRGEGG